MPSNERAADQMLSNWIRCKQNYTVQFKIMYKTPCTNQIFPREARLLIVSFPV